MGKSDWPLERYPIVFHAVLRDGGGVVELGDLPWSANSTRKRWYGFVRAAGDTRVWSVELHAHIAIFSSRFSRADDARKVLAGCHKTL